MSEATSGMEHAAPRSTLHHVGVVAIGRNEGARLERCLQSALKFAATVVYVDSGSTDGSVSMAEALGVEVMKLDLSTPFTAARSRNAGVARLLEVAPHIEFVQMVDGDCELVQGWMDVAVATMRECDNTNVAVVCGRRRERYPEATPYNRIVDMEWNTPIGEAAACGGDALIRMAAFSQVGGYDESLIAGEEPEMCWRMRHESPAWRILRIDHEMTLHDAQITRFAQWWKRNVRSGHAYAEGHAMHGKVDGYCSREVRSIAQWTVVLPLVVLGLAWFTWGASVLLLLLYVVLWARIRAYRINEHEDLPEDASLYANYCIAGKFAELQGVLKYWWGRMLGRKNTLIEYKQVSPSGVVTNGGGA